MIGRLLCRLGRHRTSPYRPLTTSLRVFRSCSRRGCHYASLRIR